MPAGTVTLGEPSPALMAKVYGALFVGGSTLVLCWLLLPHPRPGHPVALASLAVLALALGGLLLTGAGPRLPLPGFYALAVLAIVLVTTGDLLAGPESTGYLLLFFWVGPWSFVFFTRRAAMAHFGLTVAAIGLVLAQQKGVLSDPGRLTSSPAVAVWVVAVATLVMISTLVGWLRRLTLGSAAWLSAAFMESSSGFVVFGLDGRIVSANRAFAALAGRPRSDVEGRGILELMHPEDRPDCARRLLGAATAGVVSEVPIDKRIVRPDGSFAEVSLRSTLVHAVGSSEPLFFADVRDVTALKASEERALTAMHLARRRAGHQQALAELGRAALTLPVQPDLLRAVTTATVATLGAQSARLDAVDSPSDVPLAATPAVAEPPGPPEPGAETAPVQVRGDLWGRLSCRLPGERTLDADERAFLEAAADVLAGALEREDYQATLAHQSRHDALTGLPNRSLLLERLDQLLTRADRNGGRVLLLVADIDDFKHVNDSYGHEIGDAVIRELAARFRDQAPGGSTLARLGGDEFALCLQLPGSTDAEMRALAERLRVAADRPVKVHDERLHLTVSIGLAGSVAGRAEDAAALLREADAALHLAKDAGRDRVEVYDEPLRARASARLRLVSDLHEAIGTSQLVLAYQPVVDLRTNDLRAVEALLRFTHPERGPLSPAPLVETAEQTGLIVPLGRWVFGEAVRQRAAWRQQLPPHAYISVNVSPRQLTRPEFTDEVVAMLASHQVSPSLVAVEVTETALAHDPGAAASTLSSLRDIGVTILLDDFGTGYSSMSQLKTFPVDVVKLDRSFITDVTGGPAEAAIARAIIDMAHAMGMTVVAEGVETAAQVDALRGMGCDYAQGFYFARPRTAADTDDRGDGVLRPRLIDVRGA